jgi:hypothetical protein
MIVFFKNKSDPWKPAFLMTETLTSGFDDRSQIFKSIDWIP